MSGYALAMREVLCPVVVGRDEELAVLEQSLEEARSGRGGVVLLVGLVANAALGWWWADPAAGLGIAALAGVEGVRTWRAESLADTCCD